MIAFDSQGNFSLIARTNKTPKNYEKNFKKYGVTHVLISKKDIGKLIYEYRVSFSDIDESARENIVKFVFEEERRMRRKKN